MEALEMRYMSKCNMMMTQPLTTTFRLSFAYINRSTKYCEIFNETLSPLNPLGARA